MFGSIIKIYGCEHCKSINEFIEMQYEDYRMVLEYREMADRSYIEGKADAYREMTYFLEPFIYRKKNERVTLNQTEVLPCTLPTPVK